MDLPKDALQASNFGPVSMVNTEHQVLQLDVVSTLAMTLQL